MTENASALTDEYWMRLALKEAQQALLEGEVPVGAVLVKGQRQIASGRNRREKQKNALAHAEIEALDGGCKALGGWRLMGCTLYVTMEPCPMCAGALHNARIDRLVFGCPDPNNGACGSVCEMNEIYYNHQVQVCGGVLAAESTALMQRFFKQLRARKKKKDIPPDETPCAGKEQS